MPESALTVLLLDVDGVLIEDHGYHVGIARTVDYFATVIGLAGMTPTPADIEVFEANGLTSEWESCPLCVGGLLVEVLRVAPDLVLSPAIEAALAQCRPIGATGAVKRPDFARLARRAGPLIVAGSRPSRASLHVLLDEANALNLAESPRHAFEGLLHTLLDNTQNVHAAPVTQVFQHFALGSADYSRIYARPPLFETPSLLRTLDRPALSPSGRETLLSLVASGRVHAAIYTARSSLPPLDTEADSRGYSPEAESARTLVGLDDLPLIGYGRTSWLAARHNAPPDAFVKPSPVHTLAAIGAALTGHEAEALEAAYTLAEGGALQPPLDVMRGAVLALYVFEDAAGGVRAAARATELLRVAGVHVSLWAVGIVPAGGPKRAALTPLCALVAPDVNAALDTVAGLLDTPPSAKRTNPC